MLLALGQIDAYFWIDLVLSILIIGFLIYEIFRLNVSYRIITRIIIFSILLLIINIFNLRFIRDLLWMIGVLYALYLVMTLDSKEKDKVLFHHKKDLTITSKLSLSETDKLFNILNKTVTDLSNSKTGALITIERKDNLTPFLSTSGVSVDAPVSAELLETIFVNKTPLHDGAVIIRGNYKNLLANYLKSAIENFDVKGIVFSNIGNVEYLKFVNSHYGNKLKLIANYTLNVFNDNTIKELLDYDIDLIEISPELNKTNISSLCNSYGDNIEVFAYGKLPVMNTNYCFLGKSNKCYPNCDKKCFDTSKKYALVDRLGFEFRFIPDNIQTITTVFNSRITSIETKDFNVKSCRINILDETIDEINEVINTVSKGNRLEGNMYTNGNLNREI